MAKTFKRSLSLLLAVLMLTTIFAAFPITAGAASSSSTAWIFSTSDGASYDLSGKFAKNDGMTFELTNGASFEVTDRNEITLGGQTVAAFNVDSAKGIDSFAESVYVTGEGNSDKPFIFEPNYIYGYTSQTDVKNGPAIAIGEKNVYNSPNVTTVDIAKPGDGFVGMARPRTGDEYVVFMDKPDTSFLAAGGGTTARMLGVSPTNYGSGYSGSLANGQKRDFSISDTLYYLGKNASDYNLFSEIQMLRHSFEGNAGSTLYRNMEEL